MLSTPSAVSRLIIAFARGANRSESTISRLATGSGKTLERLQGGADITSGRAERAIQWLSDHWPDGAEWPPDIPRPPPNAREAA